MSVDFAEANEALRAFMDDALSNLAKQGFKTLVDESGVADAIASMKPYKNRNAYILVCMVKKRLGLRGLGIEALTIPMCMAQVGIGGVDNVHQEIREKGAVCFVDSCTYGDAIPEFCVVVSHYTTDLICEALNPEYECIWTHNLTNGDPYDRYIYRKKNGNYKDIDDLGKTVKVIPRFDVPPEEQRQLRDFVLLNVLDAVVEAFIDLHGSKKTLDILVPLAKKIGMEAGNKLAKENPGIKNDAATIGHLIDTLGQAMMQHGSAQFLSNSELRKEITHCPLQTFTNEMCKLVEGWLQGVVHTLNPNLEYEYDSMVTKGDESCRWHLRSIGAKPIAIEEVKSEAMDPLEILKVRLAKGEIGKEEYKEIRSLIYSEED